MKCNRTKLDDLSPWNDGKSFNNNGMENVNDEERSIALSVNLLLKNRNISQANLVRLPSHLVTSEICQCPRSFHIFCTDSFPLNDQDIEMIYIHPAPRKYERGSSRRISTPYKQYHHPRHQENNEQNMIITARSAPSMNIPESQLLEKKLRLPPKLPPRTTSLNIPTAYQRSLQTAMKYSSSIRLPKTPTCSAQLQIRALSVFDQSPSSSQIFIPRGPPPSPKTPTQDPSMIFLHSISAAPLRATSITPHARNSNENERQLPITVAVKNINYKDYAREYLSASDCSDNDKDENDDDEADDDDEKEKALAQALITAKPKLPVRNQPFSRSGTAFHDRLLSSNRNRYLSLAEVCYSSLDVYKTLSDKTRRRLQSQTRLMTSNNENDDALTTTTKITTTTKTEPLPQSKSVFGFSKTASSMHFGHAAGRLGLQGSFEKWPAPLSRRTPIERKQEVTALRLVTLPLVTS